MPVKAAVTEPLQPLRQLPTVTLVREVRDRPTDFPGLPESVVGRLHNAGRAQTKLGPSLIENGVKMRRFALSEAPVVLGGSKRTDEGSGVPGKAEEGCHTPLVACDGPRKM